MTTGVPTRAVKVGTKAVPTLSGGPSELLVKVRAVAINPTDWKNAELAKVGALAGCDFAGVVEQAGQGSPFRQGDKVAGFVHGNLSPDQGSFAEYVKTESSLVWRVAPATSFADAAAIGGIAGSVAVQALIIRLGLPIPTVASRAATSQKPVFLVWSGASSVGCYAVQLAKLAGYFVIATAPSGDFPYVRSLGADVCLDFTSKTVVEDIKAQAMAVNPSGVTHGLDCFSQHGSPHIAASAFGPSGGRLMTLLPPGDQLRSDVEVASTVVYTVLGKEFQLWGKTLAASSTDKDAIAQWYLACGELVGSGLFKANRLRRVAGGLDGVEEALRLSKSGTVSGEKIVLEL